MKEWYSLKEINNLPIIPTPHDGVIKEVNIVDKCLVLIFEEDLSQHYFFQDKKNSFKSLVIRYHLKYFLDEPEILLFKERKIGLNKMGYFSVPLRDLLGKKKQLEYLYHYVRTNEIMLVLNDSGKFMNVFITTEGMEYEWIA